MDLSSEISLFFFSFLGWCVNNYNPRCVLSLFSVVVLTHGLWAHLKSHSCFPTRRIFLQVGVFLLYWHSPSSRVCSNVPSLSLSHGIQTWLTFGRGFVHQAAKLQAAFSSAFGKYIPPKLGAAQDKLSLLKTPDSCCSWIFIFLRDLIFLVCISPCFFFQSDWFQFFRIFQIILGQHLIESKPKGRCFLCLVCELP